MPPEDPIAALDAALAFDRQGLLLRPLDVIGWINAAADGEPARREALWLRMFLEAPLPYWSVARWAVQFDAHAVSALLQETSAPGWRCVARHRQGEQPSREGVLSEIAKRFDEFDPDLYPWVIDAAGDDPPQYQKYLLGRDLARSYVEQAADGLDRRDARSTLLRERKPAWQEWIDLNTNRGHSAAATSDATSLVLDRMMAEPVSEAATGVGRTHILLEQLTVTKNPAVGVVTAAILPVPEDYHHLDGIITPDLKENGLLLMSKEFLAGVATAWEYYRATTGDQQPSLLSFSIRPTVASVVQQLSGRSAELAVLAAIESAARKRALRPNAVASASLNLYGPEGAYSDPQTGPASFEDKKFLAAIRHRMKTVVVHPEVAHQWNQQNREEKAKGEPDVVASEYYRRDALRFLETRSLWKMAITVPAAVTTAYAILALFWQMYKLSAVVPDQETIVLAARLPLVPPALLLSELVCLAICLYIIWLSFHSVSVSLDSRRSAWVAMGVCTAVVLSSQFLPIGVRGEGLLDNPIYSVLFGELQVKAEQVVAGGGSGFLILHTISQTIGFLAILYGTSAFVLRLIQTRAHGEPHFDDRCSLIASDWRFSLSMIVACMTMIFVFSLPRNLFFYYYLTTLPDVALVDHSGSMLAVTAPLIGIWIVLSLSVGIVWLIAIASYLVRVVDAARGRSGYRPADVVTRLPRLARLIYSIRPST